MRGLKTTPFCIILSLWGASSYDPVHPWDEEDEFAVRNVKGLKEKWELPNENVFAESKEEARHLLEKWDDEKLDLKTAPEGLKEKWDLADEINVQHPTLPSFTEKYRYTEKERRNLIGHLQDVAYSQSKILSLLKRIERRYDGKKKCSHDNLKDQKSTIIDLNSLDMKSSALSDDITLSLGDDKLIRIHRSAKMNPYVKDLKTKLAIAKAKRARIIELLEELKNHDSLAPETEETPSVSDSLHQKFCAKLKTQAIELKDANKLVQNRVKKRKYRIEQLIMELASEQPTEYSQQPASTTASVAKKQPIATTNSTISTTKPTTPSLVRVAGHVSKGRCRLCEDLDGEEVCGDNGKTYRTLCHAVNCAGLALRDIVPGACITKDVCAHSNCGHGSICIPILHGPCLAMYSDDGYGRIPCQQYTCMNKSCDSRNFTQVCGMDGVTYNSLCELHKVGELLAYTGSCRPLHCKGEVCGTDKNTYESACHARAHNTKVDYSGKCFLNKWMNSQGLHTSCALIRKRGRCVKEALCNKPILPIDACCPICGGIAHITLTDGLSEYLNQHHEENHLYVLENMLRHMLPPYAARKCDLFTSLTDSGNISLIVEAINPGDRQECQDGLLTITNAIKHKKSHSHGPEREFKMAAFISAEAWFRNTLVSFQDRVTDIGADLRDQANAKIGETVQDVDNKIHALPSGSALSLLMTVEACIMFVSFVFLLLLY